MVTTNIDPIDPALPPLVIPQGKCRFGAITFPIDAIFMGYKPAIDTIQTGIVLGCFMSTTETLLYTLIHPDFELANFLDATEIPYYKMSVTTPYKIIYQKTTQVITLK